MILEYIMIIASVLLLGGQFAFQRLFQLKSGTAFRNTLLFNSLLGIFGATLCCGFIFIAYHRAPAFSTYSLVLALLMAACTTAYTLLGFIMMKNFGMTLFTVFLMMGGMTLPYIYGVARLGEECTFFNIGGLFMILAGIILANLKKGGGGAKNIAIGVVVFVVNGMCSIISKTHQIETVYATVSSPDFTFWTSVGKFALCSLILPLMKPQATQPAECGLSKKSLFCLLAAVAFVPASILQFAAAKTLPATVLYPIVSGGLIIISAFIDRIFFKEKISRAAVAGIALCFLGTCLFL